MVLLDCTAPGDRGVVLLDCSAPGLTLLLPPLLRLLTAPNSLVSLDSLSLVLVSGLVLGEVSLLLLLLVFLVLLVLVVVLAVAGSEGGGSTSGRHQPWLWTCCVCVHKYKLLCCRIRASQCVHCCQW